MARPRQFDEEQVLRDVRDQFWDAGYAATSLDDLVGVSKLGKGSLYAAFGDKHRLFLRALDGYIEAGRVGLSKVLAETPRALDALRAFVTAAASDPTGEGARRGCFLANSISELATADPDVVAAARRTYDTAVDLVAECVTRAQREGDVSADADPVAFARELLAAQQGIVYLGRSGMDIEQLTSTAHSLAARLLPGR